MRNFFGQIFLATLIAPSFAHADCTTQRSGTTYSSTMPGTCLSRLSSELYNREAIESSGRVMVAAVDMIPFANVIRTTLVETAGGYEIPFETNQRLNAYLNEYMSSVDFSRNVANAEAVMKIFEASVDHYLALNNLLNDKRFRPEERQLIKSRMAEIKFLSEQAILMIGQKKSAQVDQRIQAIEKELSDKLGNIDFGKFMAQLKGVNDKISEVQLQIDELSKNPLENKIKIRELKGQQEELKTQLDTQARLSKVDIQNYTQFAQGMVALYSLINPEDANRLNAAVSGISNIAMGAVALQSLGAAASAGAAMGGYGMIAMGAVQLYSASKNQKESNSGFKAIFAQLKAISEQIEAVQKHIDKRFDRIDETLFVMERNILKELNRISSQIASLTELVDYSARALVEINKSIRDLSLHVVNESIENRIYDRYLDVIYTCVGRVTADITLKPDELGGCFDRMSLWIENEISTSLMTSKTISYQFEARNNFAFQVNDLANDFASFSRDRDLVGLSNPLLLQDASDSLNIMKLQYQGKSRYRKQLEHEVFQKSKNMEEKFRKFQTKLKSSPEYIAKLKERHQVALNVVHSQVLNERAQLDQNGPLQYHKNQLQAFKDSLNRELAKRGEPRVENPAASAHDNVVVRDFNLTLTTLQTLLENIKDLRYENDLLELIKNDELLVFMESCVGTNGLNVQIPMPITFLKEKIGVEATQRALLNPDRAKFCYNLELKKDVMLFGFAYNKQFDSQLVKERTSAEGDIAIKYRPAQNGGIIITPPSLEGKYRGDFLVSLTIEGTLDNEKILLEKSTEIFEKLSWRNNATDPYSLLTVISRGKAYHRQYPVTTVPMLPRNAVTNSASNRNCVAFCRTMFSGTTTTSSDVNNSRVAMLKRDQKKLWEDSLMSYKLTLAYSLNNSVDKINMKDVTETGRLLTLALYYRDPKAFQANADYQLSLSEVWGLRSEPFLKKLYKDAISSDPSSEMLDYVKKNQLTILEGVL